MIYPVSVKERIVICGVFTTEERDWLLDIINLSIGETTMLSNDDIDRMTPAQLNAFVASDNVLARARHVFVSQMGSISEETEKHRTPDIIKLRRMELKAVLAIINILGVRL